MPVYRQVMVASDLSARCDRAVDRGVLLARAWNSKVSIAHILSEDASDSTIMEEKVRAVLPDPGMDARILFGRGSVPETLQELANETEADLILTGVARYNSPGDFLLGTAVDHIIRRSDIPVLIVKKRPHRPYRNILVATDLSNCSRAALLRAADLFPQAALHLIHAYHVPFEAWLDSPDMRAEVSRTAEADLETFLAHAALDPIAGRIEARIGYGETERVVGDRLKKTDADLLVMGTHGHSGFVHATLGSMAESILSWADVDTLMVRDRR
ncbi:universal stress protein [Sphingobium indicum]|uniref:universal stress protein n=1 Tax=Sphingobium TaxID=165695 RepID=UPI0009F491EE|nr:universal stress protein [Sphingobium sp. Ndbn-10]